MIYSFPSMGKTVQIDLDSIDSEAMDLIRKAATGSSRVRLKDGQVLEINNNQFGEDTLEALKKNLVKDHYHPMDYEAPFFKGGISESVHELVNPGERSPGKNFWGTVADTGARTLGGLRAFTKEPGMKIDIALARSPEGKQKAEDKYKEWKQEEEEFFNRHGGRDVFSGIGEAVPELALMVGSGGASSALTGTAKRTGLKAISKGLEKAALEGVPRKIALKTATKQGIRWGAETAAEQGLAGGIYGAVKSGGDPKETLKEAATWAAFTPVMGAAGLIGSRNIPGIRNAIKDTKNIASDYWQKFNAAVGHRIYSTLNVLKKYGEGTKLNDEAVLNQGARGKAYQMITHELRQALRPVEGMKTPLTWQGEQRYAHEIVSDVAKARRAFEITRLGKNAGVFFKSGKAQGILDDFAQLQAQNPELAAAVEGSIQELQHVNDRLLNYWLEKGVLDKESFDRISGSSEFYMPYHRVLDEEKIALLKAEGKSGQAAAALKELKGSELDVHDVIENIALNYMNMIPAVDRHVLLREIVDALPSNMKSPVEIAQPALAWKLETVDKDGVSEVVKKLFAPQIERRPGEISFLRNGQWELWDLKDDMLVETLKKTYHPEGIIRALQVMKNIKRVGVTANPIFMTRNAARDFVTRIMNDGNLVRDPRIAGWQATANDAFWFLPKAAKKAVVEFPLAALEVIAGSTENKVLKTVLAAAAKPFQLTDVLTKGTGEYTGGRLMKNLNLEGAGGSEMRAVSRENMKQVIREAAGIKTPLVEYISPKTLLKPIEWLEEVGRLIEQTPRLEAAHRVFEKTRDINKAALEYRKITADFAQMGTFSKGPAGQVSPFLSAQFAGMKSEFEAMKQNPIGWTIKMVELLAIPTIIYWLIKHDTEDYKGRDIIDKNMYYFLTPTLRIPKGYGMHAFMSNAIERSLDRMAGDPEAIKGLWEAVALWAPSIPLPPALGVAYGVTSNTDPFFGTPIEPRYSEYKPWSERSKPTTTEVAKTLGRPFQSTESRSAVSPAKIDFAVRELGGGLSTTATRGIDWMATRGQNRMKAATGLERVPGVDAFVTRPANTNSYSGEIQRFHDNFGKSDTAYHSIKTAYDSGDQASYQRMMNNQTTYKNAVVYEQIKDIKNYISEGNRTYKMVADPRFTGNEETGPLTPETKRQLLDSIAQKMNAAAAQANKIYYSATR